MSNVRDWITRSSVTPSTSSITRIGSGRVPMSNVTKRARLRVFGSMMSADASSRNILRNSSCERLRAAVAL